jgi:hypothetical protein
MKKSHNHSIGRVFGVLGVIYRFAEKPGLSREVVMNKYMRMYMCVVSMAHQALLV